MSHLGDDRGQTAHCLFPTGRVDKTRGTDIIDDLFPSRSGPTIVEPESSSPPRGPKGLRRLIEFQPSRTHDLTASRNVSRQVYDGPAGAMLSLASRLSLHEPLLGRLLRRGAFDVSGCGRILDIGSGAGQILRHLLAEANADATIVAADLSLAMMRRARERLRSPRPLFMNADVTQLPFADEAFDCVTCGWVIEHLPRPEPGLTEISRVLRPGGRLLLLATEDNFAGALNSRTWKCRTYNRDELRAACDSCGLDWGREFHLSPVHRRFKMGGIIVEAVRRGASEPGN